MREHKYRIWTGKEMVYDYMDLSLFHGILLPDGDDILLENTGDKDHQDTEIHEGDILTPKWYKKIAFGTVVVVYKLGMFCFELNPPFITVYRPLYKSLALAKASGNDYEKIGNIYENPELLKKE